MKRTKSIVLDDLDNQAVELFSDLGMPKNLAKTLLYISQVEECRSAEVEQGADLRQPEVSVAMQELRKRGWVSKRDIKKQGKGRPVHIYKLNTELPKILKSFEEEKLKELEDTRTNLTQLNSLIEELTEYEEGN